MRMLHGELGKAQSELGKLESAAKRMQGGTSVNVADWKKLQGEITKSKARVTELNTQIVRGGGAGFDTKAYDDKQKKSQEDRSKSLAAGTAKNAAAMRMVGAAAGAAVAGALIVGGIALAGFAAVGQRALASQAGAQIRLNAITARYNLGLRDISKNANLTPFLNSADKLAAMFDKNTATGKFMGVQVKRAFDAVGSAVTALTPYAEKAFAKMLIATIKVETAFWKVVGAAAGIGASIAKSIASSPAAMSAITSAANDIRSSIDSAKQSVSEIGSAFTAIGADATVMSAALGVARTYISVLSIGLGALGGFVSGIIGTMAGFGKVVKSVLAGDVGGAVDGLKAMVTSAFSAMTSSLFGFLRIAATAVDAIAGTDYASKLKGVENSIKGQLKEWGKPTPENTKNGQDVGSNIGKGIASGLQAEIPAIEAAGAAAAAAALKGAQTKAEIKSPSRAARRDVGQQIGRGTALGMLDEAGNIQSAAERALVPNFSALDAKGSSASMSGGSSRSKIMQFNNCNFNGTLTEADMEAMLIRLAQKQLGSEDLEASQ